MKSCSVYLRDNTFIIISHGKTKEGFQIEKEPVYVLKSTEFPEIIGMTVQKALDEFVENIPLPLDSSLTKYVGLRYAKVQSYKAFLENTKLVNVQFYHHKYQLIPTINGGYSGENKGFSYREEESLIFENTTVMELGKKILQAFGSCTIEL